MNKAFLFIKSFFAAHHHMPVLRYVMVGFSNVLMCFFWMYVGARLGLHYLEYTVFGYLISILYSFYMNLRFTFRVQGRFVKRLLIFFAINLINLVFVEWIEYFLIESMHFKQIVAIVCGMTWYAVMGYLFNKMWVYQA